VTWNPRRKNWLGRARDPAPPAEPPDQRAPVPPGADEAVLIVPPLPMFSPAAIADLLHAYRSTVQYWLENDKLASFTDNIGQRYVLREELIRFVRDYLRRAIDEE